MNCVSYHVIECIGLVSILVLVDVALELSTDSIVIHPSLVSILVLVDVALEQHWCGCQSISRIVSILVLVDVALEPIAVHVRS